MSGDQKTVLWGNLQVELMEMVLVGTTAAELIAVLVAELVETMADQQDSMRVDLQGKLLDDDWETLLVVLQVDQTDFLQAFLTVELLAQYLVVGKVALMVNKKAVLLVKMREMHMDHRWGAGWDQNWVEYLVVWMDKLLVAKKVVSMGCWRVGMLDILLELWMVETKA